MYQLFFHCFEEASERRKVAGGGIASVTARRTCDGAVGLGEVLEERDGGRRVIGEAVEEEERARVARAADERVNLAERQRERGAGQPLMRCVHKSDQLQVAC